MTALMPSADHPFDPIKEGSSYCKCGAMKSIHVRPEKIAAERLAENWFKENRPKLWSILSLTTKFNEELFAAIAAYAQGPRADAGVLEKILELAHNYFLSSRLTDQRNFVDEIRKLAKSALSQPQDDYTEHDGKDLPDIGTRQLCAECHKPIALRHVMEGDGTHKAVPSPLQWVSLCPTCKTECIGPTELAAKFTASKHCNSSVPPTAQPTAEGPKPQEQNVAIFGSERGGWPCQVCGYGHTVNTSCQPTLAPQSENDLYYFSPTITLHGCAPDENGKCAVACCSCKCHNRPAPETLSAEKPQNFILGRLEDAVDLLRNKEGSTGFDISVALLIETAIQAIKSSGLAASSSGAPRDKQEIEKCHKMLTDAGVLEHDDRNNYFNLDKRVELLIAKCAPSGAEARPRCNQVAAEIDDYYGEVDEVNSDPVRSEWIGQETRAKRVAEILARAFPAPAET